jgi:hypothetical protein
MEYIGPAAGGAGAAIKIIEFSFRLNNVANETSDFVNIVAAIETDLNEAIRLRNVHCYSLDTHSLSRIDTVIDNTKSAISGVATLVEDPRVDVRERGRVGMGNKLTWAFRDSQEMKTKQAYLATCHQSLLSIITELKGQGGGERSVAPPAYGALPYDEEDGRKLMAALKREHSGSKRRPHGGQSQQFQQLPTPPFSPPAPEHLSHGTSPTLSDWTPN